MFDSAVQRRNGGERRHEKNLGPARAEPESFGDAGAGYLWAHDAGRRQWDDGGTGEGSGNRSGVFAVEP